MIQPNCRAADLTVLFQVSSEVYETKKSPFEHEKSFLSSFQDGALRNLKGIDVPSPHLCPEGTWECKNWYEWNVDESVCVEKIGWFHLQ